MVVFGAIEDTNPFCFCYYYFPYTYKFKTDIRIKKCDILAAISMERPSTIRKINTV